jgi:putative aminopeptidase FrvX
MESIKLLERLSLAFGPSGCEYEVADILIKGVGEGVSVSRDKLGSIILEKKGTSAEPKVMVAAHIDEVGFIIQSITEKGFLRFHPIGGWTAEILPGQRVLIQGKKRFVEGVIGSVPPHFLKDREKSKAPDIEDMLIDIGAESEKQVTEEFGIEIGSFATPSPFFQRMNNSSFYMGKAFDDRIGCSLLIDLFLTMKTKSHPNILMGAGTVQEEVGLRGARTAAESIGPDVAIVLEAPPADDFPGIAKDKPQGAVKGGVQIRCFDPTMIGNVRLKDFVVETAKKHDVKYQLAVRTGGGTDAGAIHLSGTGVPSIVLGVPVRYIHAPVGMMSLEDYENALKLLQELVKSLDRERAAGF